MIKKPRFKQAPEAIVLGLVAGLLTIYLLTQWRLGITIHEIIFAAAAIGLLSALSRKVAKWVAFGWMGLGHFMGKVVGTVLLSLVYLLFLTPLAMLQSLFTKSEKFKSRAWLKTDSAWIDRTHEFSRKDMKELW